MNKKEEKNTVKSTTKKYDFEKPLAKGQNLKELACSQDPVVALNARYQSRYIALRQDYAIELEAAELEKYVLECKNLQLYIEDVYNFKAMGASLLMNSNYTKHVQIKLIVNCKYYSTEEFNSSTARRLCFSDVHKEIPMLCDDEIIVATRDHNAVDEIKNGLRFYTVNTSDPKDHYHSIHYQIIEEGQVIKQGNYSSIIEYTNGIQYMIDHKIHNEQIRDKQIRDEQIQAQPTITTKKTKKKTSSIFDEVDELFI